MKYEEIKQLRAFAWYDGIYLSIIWMASFACFLAATWQSLLGQVSSLLILSTPFFVAFRLKKFRDTALEGAISFNRACVYNLRVFFNAALLFSIMQYAYMAFVDHGKVAQIVTATMMRPEYDEVYKMMQVDKEQFLQFIPEAFSPLPMTLNSFIYEIIFGVFFGIIIAALMAKKKKNTQHVS
ncbi:MAG: DUF4199 domain-containing protein [Prevotella sp.]|nr:DUF4199 domain-containing protein [Prevotella sp.]MDD7273922.1 DUF4199 domain-containing protein [Prevotellaceae bacterium]MDY3936317.1 DUF4199 domain-containing protein [Prevotella sp.]MDY4218565.1 DUF4199 domain-containing protein [Prevotella sp.]